MSRPALPLLALLLLSACAGPPPLGEGASAIIGGALDTGDPAVVWLVSYPPDLSTFDTCTAALIAPKVLLTAAHCVDAVDHPGYLFGAFTGPDATAYPTIEMLEPQLAHATEAHAHPDYDPTAPFHADLGVVLLEAALPATPLPINRAALAASVVGEPARLVGYGQTVYMQFNAVKHDATTVVASLGAEDTVAVGDTKSRSCVGDSGGPALVKIDGVETIIGVDSYTELAGCLEPSNYRRTDTYLPFLDTYAPPPATTDAGTDGGGGGEGGAGSQPPATSHGCALGGTPSGAAPGVALLLLALARWRRRRG